MSNFESAMDHIFLVEGESYTNHPKDRGGPTKFGITIKTLQAWAGGDIKPHHVQSLDKETATKIYKELYWDKLFLDDIDDSKKCLVAFDSAVHCGPKAAIKLIQKSLNEVKQSFRSLDVDGVMGPKTIRLFKVLNTKRFAFEFFKASQNRYVNLVKRRPSQMVFLQGWINRTYAVLEHFI